VEEVIGGGRGDFQLINLSLKKLLLSSKIINFKKFQFNISVIMNF
jgi:hypothetical protein